MSKAQKYSDTYLFIMSDLYTLVILRPEKFWFTGVSYCLGEKEYINIEISTNSFKNYVLLISEIGRTWLDSGLVTFSESSLFKERKIKLTTIN